jgi:DNA replication protein DnaC
MYHGKSEFETFSFDRVFNPDAE